MASVEKKIRVGVVGAGRGQTFAHQAGNVGMEFVALCDIWEEHLLEVGKRYGVATYTDYDKFLEHDMDAVVLANYYHEHAPFAIKAFAAGKHVMSECIACKTPAEGVALARAVEKYGLIYMFAENYAYFAYNQEMRRLYQAGEIGEIQYMEGEYNHPIDSRTYNMIAPGYEPLAQPHSADLLPHPRDVSADVCHRHATRERERALNTSFGQGQGKPARSARGRRRDHPLPHEQWRCGANHGALAEGPQRVV
jgi:predicted dehydrogenase